MGKISKVLYAEIDPSECSTKEVAGFYYHFNLIPVDSFFHKGYEKYEIKQNDIKNRLLGDLKKDLSITEHPKIHTSILALSSIHDRTILMADIM